MHPSSEAVHGWDGVFGEFLYFPLNFVLNLKLLKKKKNKKTRSSSAPAGRTPRGGSCVKSDAERGGGYSPGGQLPEFTLSALVFSLWSLTPSALWVSVSRSVEWGR